MMQKYKNELQKLNVTKFQVNKYLIRQQFLARHKNNLSLEQNLKLGIYGHNQFDHTTKKIIRCPNLHTAETTNEQLFPKKYTE